MHDIDALKKRVIEEVDARRGQLIAKTREGEITKGSSDRVADRARFTLPFLPVFAISLFRAFAISRQ